MYRDGSNALRFYNNAESKETFRIGGSNEGNYLIAQSNSQVRLVLGSTGNATNNTSNWIRGAGNELGLNSGGGNIGVEIGGNAKMTVNTTGQILANSLGVTTPTFSFINDTNTGMTRPTTDTLQFVTGSEERIRFNSTGAILPDGPSAFEQNRPFFGGANAASYTTSTNLAYTKSTDQYVATGEHFKARVRARAYTKYIHMKTNLASDNAMFFFRINGYFYNYGMNESVRGGYTYQGGVIAESVQHAYRSNSNFTIGDFYRSSSGGFLCLRLDVHHSTYTEGEALVYFGSHSNVITRELQITDMQHRDDGNNAY